MKVEYPPAFELFNALIRDGHKVYLVSGREVPKTEIALKAMFDVERLPVIIPLQRSSAETYSLKSNVEMAKELLLWSYQGSHLIRNITPDMIIAMALFLYVLQISRWLCVTTWSAGHSASYMPMS